MVTHPMATLASRGRGPGGIVGTRGIVSSDGVSSDIATREKVRPVGGLAALF